MRQGKVERSKAKERNNDGTKAKKEQPLAARRPVQGKGEQVSRRPGADPKKPSSATGGSQAHRDDRRYRPTAMTCRTEGVGRTPAASSASTAGREGLQASIRKDRRAGQGAFETTKAKPATSSAAMEPVTLPAAFQRGAGDPLESFSSPKKRVPGSTSATVETPQSRADTSLLRNWRRPKNWLSGQ